MRFSLVKGTPFRIKCTRCGASHWAGDIPRDHPALFLVGGQPVYVCEYPGQYYCQPCVLAVEASEVQIGRASE